MPNRLGFTHDQRWELVRITGAAVVSTIFFGVPMFVARPEVMRSEVARAAAQPAPQVHVVTSEAVVPETTPALAWGPSTVVRPAGVTPSQRNPARATAQPRQRASGVPASVGPLARKLGRLLAGSGQYEVRPFPAFNH